MAPRVEVRQVTSSRSASTVRSVAIAGVIDTHLIKLCMHLQDDSIDAIPIAFLDVFFSTGGQPQLDLANVRFPLLLSPDCLVTTSLSDLQLQQ